MKHLLRNWEETKDLFSDPIFFASDFDGTLTPIESDSEENGFSEKIREDLAELSDFCPVAIISARSLKDLKSRIGIKNIYYSGNHGHEISGPDVDYVSKKGTKAQIEINKVCDEIRQKTDTFDGVKVIDKGFTASIDYSSLDREDLPQLMKIMNRRIDPLTEKGIIDAIHSKNSVEIRPSGWDKWTAVSLLKKVTGFEEEMFTIYMGDDIADEDVFFGLKDDGLGILVSNEGRETAAQFRLKGVGEVEIFLGKLLNLMKET